MLHDRLAGPGTDDVGVANSVGALRSIGGGAWLVGVVVMRACNGWVKFFCA